MRIGIDARPLAFQRTGIGNYLHNLVLNISEMDSENEYFLFSNVDFQHPVLERANWHKVISSDRIGALWLGLKLPLILKKHSIELFWGTQHMVPLYKPRGIKYIVTMHDYALFFYPYVATRYLNIINRIFIPRSLVLSDKVIAVSESTKRDTIKLFKTRPDKIVSIEEGGRKDFMPVDRTEAVERIRQKLGIDYPYLLYVGTIEPRKNLDTLVKAFNDFSKNHGEYKLVLAGKMGWKYENTLQLIERLNLKDKVIFPGYVGDEDMVYLYNASSLFVYPSLYEGFGLPVLEAMQCGLNVITSKVSSLPEVLTSEEALVDPQDFGGLAEKINHFIFERDIYNAENYELSKRFSWKAAAVKTHELILQLQIKA